MHLWRETERRRGGEEERRRKGHEERRKEGEKGSKRKKREREKERKKKNVTEKESLGKKWRKKFKITFLDETFRFNLKNKKILEYLRRTNRDDLSIRTEPDVGKEDQKHGRDPSRRT